MRPAISTAPRTEYATTAERTELALLTVSGATILCVLLASMATLLG